MGFAATPSIKLEDVFGAVERAVKLAKAAGRVRKSPVALSEERLAKFSYSLPDIALDPVELAKTLDEYAAKDLTVRRFYVNIWTTEKRILTSDGADAYSKIQGLCIRHFYQT